ncbi:MAG TPA: hypothetical protein PKL31_15040 [Fulvivirga sp.]|nr:hypothetical protein [Fulvivirga sp.]
MRNLKLNNHPIFLLICAIFIGHQLNAQSKIPEPYINHASEGLIYNASFYYKDFSVSGLLVMKKQPTGYHVVLLAKMGPTLMDFIITDEDVIWKKAVKSLDNGLVTSQMEKDFRIMLLTPLENPRKIKVKKRNRFKVKKAITLIIETDTEGKRIKKAKTKRFGNFFKTFVSYHYMGDNLVPDQMRLRHRMIKLRIELNQLEQ